MKTPGPDDNVYPTFYAEERDKDGCMDSPAVTLDGITLRTWLAGMALSGTCRKENLTYKDIDNIALRAVSIADVVIKELGKP